MVFEPQFAKKLAIFYGLGFYLVIARLNQYSLLNPGCFRENPFDVFSLIENKNINSDNNTNSTLSCV